MNKCFLCEGNSYMCINNSNYIEILDGNRLDVEIESSTINVEINYCPICGKKLEPKKDKGYVVIDR